MKSTSPPATPSTPPRRQPTTAAISTADQLLLAIGNRPVNAAGWSRRSYIALIGREPRGSEFRDLIRRVESLRDDGFLEMRGGLFHDHLFRLTARGRRRLRELQKGAAQ